MHRKTVILACLLMGLAVGLGAFGAHGLADILLKNGRLDTYDTAVLYHFIHALGMLFIGISPIRHKKIPTLFFMIGILCFCGSLYLLSLTNMLWLGAIAPIGGLSFILGWISVAWSAYNYQPSV